MHTGREFMELFSDDEYAYIAHICIGIRGKEKKEGGVRELRGVKRDLDIRISRILVFLCTLTRLVDRQHRSFQ